jgi:hypothetical protein
MSRERERWGEEAGRELKVPWIWKKGRPTVVCHDWGDLRMRLFRVSRIFLSFAKKYSRHEQV